LPDQWKTLAVVPQEGLLLHKLREKNIETRIIPLSQIRPWNFHKILSNVLSYLTLCLSFKPDLIYANGSRAALYGGFIGQILKIPIIWHCRIADPDIYLDPLLYRLSSKIIANSQATTKRFKPRFQNKVRMIYNGIDIGWLQNGSIKKPGLIQPDWKVILIVARISRWKRHDLALSTFEKIALLDPKLHLVCIGAQDQLEPKWYNCLMKRTKQSKFSNRIHWIGQVSDVRPWYQSAEILLLPSENEPFGRVVVEAMACGVPVIATRSGGVPEIVRHQQDGLLVPLGNDDEMAYAILKILKNETMRERFSRSAMNRSETFNLDKHIKEMTQIFDSMIER